jgi:hypothetical protein
LKYNPPLKPKQHQANSVSKNEHLRREKNPNNRLIGCDCFLFFPQKVDISSIVELKRQRRLPVKVKTELGGPMCARIASETFPFGTVGQRGSTA